MPARAIMLILDQNSRVLHTPADARPRWSQARAIRVSVCEHEKEYEKVYGKRYEKCYGKGCEKVYDRICDQYATDHQG